LTAIDLIEGSVHTGGYRLLSRARLFSFSRMEKNYGYWLFSILQNCSFYDANFIPDRNLKVRAFINKLPKDTVESNQFDMLSRTKQNAGKGSQKIAW